MTPPPQPPPGRQTPQDRDPGGPGGPGGRARPEVVAAQTRKADAVAAAARRRPQGVSTHRTTRGTVTIGAVTVEAGDADTPAAVTVTVLAGVDNPDPHFRVINPPRFAPDPNGTIEINGQRFTDDPLAVLAEVVAAHGGTRRDPRRGTPL